MVFGASSLYLVLKVGLTVSPSIVAAGIFIAFMAGELTETNRTISEWATDNNPFFNGPNSDRLSVIQFLVLTVLLYFVRREWLLAGR